MPSTPVTMMMPDSTSASPQQQIEVEDSAQGPIKAAKAPTSILRSHRTRTDRPRNNKKVKMDTESLSRRLEDVEDEAMCAIDNCLADWCIDPERLPGGSPSEYDDEQEETLPSYDEDAEEHHHDQQAGGTGNNNNSNIHDNSSGGGGLFSNLLWSSSNKSSNSNAKKTLGKVDPDLPRMVHLTNANNGKSDAASIITTKVSLDGSHNNNNSLAGNASGVPAVVTAKAGSTMASLASSRQGKTTTTTSLRDNTTTTTASLAATGSTVVAPSLSLVDSESTMSLPKPLSKVLTTGECSQADAARAAPIAASSHASAHRSILQHLTKAEATTSEQATATSPPKPASSGWSYWNIFSTAPAAPTIAAGVARSQSMQSSKRSRGNNENEDEQALPTPTDKQFSIVGITPPRTPSTRTNKTSNVNKSLVDQPPYAMDDKQLSLPETEESDNDEDLELNLDDFHAVTNNMASTPSSMDSQDGDDDDKSTAKGASWCGRCRLCCSLLALLIIVGAIVAGVLGSRTVSSDRSAAVDGIRIVQNANKPQTAYPTYIYSEPVSRPNDTPYPTYVYNGINVREPAPALAPTRRPRSSPTTPSPVVDPTRRPRPAPTPEPTRRPRAAPTTASPVVDPTPEPTRRPRPAPTPEPTPRPTRPRTDRPTRSPTSEPTEFPVEVVSFGATGDAPYSSDQAVILREQMEDLRGVEFLVHVGDLRDAQYRNRCERSEYEAAADILKESRVPVFVLLGDNDWNDCPNQDEALEYWEDSFSGFESKHWDHDFKIFRQPGREHNFGFVHKNVLFMGFNIVGGDPDGWREEREWEERLGDEANWAKSVIADYDISMGRQTGRVVIFGHADPRESHAPFFDPLYRFVERRLNNRIPILYVNGDAHEWKYNTYFFQQRSWLRITLPGEVAEPVTKIYVVSNGEEQDVELAFQFDRGLD